MQVESTTSIQEAISPKKRGHDSDLEQPPVSKRKFEDDLNVDDQDTSYLGNAANFVANQYELLKRILNWLPARDLARCARVCTAWDKASKIIQRERGRGKPTPFWWRTPEEFRKHGVSKYAAKEVEDDLLSKLSQLKEQLDFRPRVIIVFFTNLGRIDIGKILEAKFPGVPVFGGTSTGIVATDTSGKSLEIEFCKKFVGQISMLFIPPWPGVTFDTLGMSKEDEPEMSSIEIPKTDAAILITPENQLEKISIQNNDIVLGGASAEIALGLHRALLVNNVRCAVILLNQKIRTESKIKQELTRLKGKFNEKTAFGVMMACCGRGSYFYKGKKNVESKVFNEMFPNIPLVGFFGGGEMGFNSSNTYAEEENFEVEAGELDEEVVFHGFTTVFMVISPATSPS